MLTFWNMTRYNTLIISIAAAWGIVPSAVWSLEPTLNELDAEAESVLPAIGKTYNLTELNGNLPEGAVIVTINSNDYYFMPDGTDAELLTVLAGTSAGALAEASDGLFEYDGKKYAFNLASLPSSAFTYQEGSESNYDFIVPEADGEGKLSNKYYKISVLQNEFSSAQNIAWEKVSAEGTDIIKLELPNGETQYFKYTYTDVPDRTKYTKTQTSLTGDVDADFVNIRRGFSSGGGISNSNTGTIDGIKGSFVFDYAPYGGGAVSNAGTIGDITSDFIANYTGLTSKGQKGNGGAIYNQKNAEIGNVTGAFIANSAGQGDGDGSGGAIYNEGTMKDITGKFVANTANTKGGAISNNGTMGNITADFVANHADNTNGSGGAIYNGSSQAIGNITGDFVANSTATSGGALYNEFYAKIGDITGDFIGNTAGVKAGAIQNEGTINKISGDFIGNTANSDNETYGAGAINNGGMGTINGISGNFIGNTSLSHGGAIKNQKEIKNIDGDFIANSAGRRGGAIYNDLNKTIGNISGDFIGNTAAEYGGAIYGNTGAKFGSVSGNFLNNSAKAGGAVYTLGNMTFASGADTYFMSGNYTQNGSYGKIYNAVLGNTTSEFTFDTSGGGNWVINDNLRNGIYNFTGDDVVDALTGTTAQSIAVNNDIINVGSVTVSGTTLKFGDYQHDDQSARNWDGKGAFAAALNADGSVNRDDPMTSLTLNNAVFNLANDYQDIVNLKGYSATDSFLHINVDPDNMTADELHISGNVEGETKMIVHASSDTDIRGKGGIMFAQSENDATGNEGSFLVSRVYKSPYLYDVKYTSVGSNANQWDLVMNDDENPDKNYVPDEPDAPDEPDVPDVPGVPDVPDISFPEILHGQRVAPEVIAYQALPVAALEQTKGMIENIDRQVQGNRIYCRSCGFYDYYWDGKPFNTLWANAVYYSSRNKENVDIDADVWGLEAGGTLQYDLYNKLGLFFSYRKGRYDMNGDGRYYYSITDSKIDIDSYLAGLYYRYSHKNWWAFATLFGGIQQADMKTQDGITSEADGIEFGGSAEIGYDYALNRSYYVTPEAGLFYTQIKYDDASDSAGKTARYSLLQQLEAIFGVKLTQKFDVIHGYGNVYIKPSLIQTFNSGDDVKITGLRKTNMLKNQTLGRLEIGGRYGFSDYISAYGWVNHTFGSHYKASTVGLGITYNW